MVIGGGWSDLIEVVARGAICVLRSEPIWSAKNRRCACVKSVLRMTQAV